MNDDRRTNRPPLLGCVADDVTGATDMAINLVQGGMRVVQFLSVPTETQLAECNCDAVVVALKTRSIPVAQAIAQSLSAIESLKDHGCERFFFKYCSTFDSTPEGNIGQVADAMLNHLQVDQTIVCPAFPRTGRTVYQSHLFVNGALLNESGMQHHPLNPMTDANLVRWLEAQSENQVGSVTYEAIAAGADAIIKRLDALRSDGIALAVVDCCEDGNLPAIAESVARFTLVTGGSGIGRFLPDAWRSERLLGETFHDPKLPTAAGRSLIIAGSCSQMTQLQVKNMRPNSNAFLIDVENLLENPAEQRNRFERWFSESASDDSIPVMVSSSADQNEVAELQEQFGKRAVSEAIETFHADVACNMITNHGVRRLIVAGGETSGAVVNRLGIAKLQIGPEICAGVPWTQAETDFPIAIALKSGNFGDENFFQTALEMLG